MGKSSGMVPNFAMDVNLLLSMLLGGMQGMNSQTLSKPQNAVGFDKMKESVASATDEFLKQTDHLRAGGTINFQGKDYGTQKDVEAIKASSRTEEEKAKAIEEVMKKVAKDFGAEFEKAFKKAHPGAKFDTSKQGLADQAKASFDYRQNIARTEEKIKKGALIGSIAAPMVGGVASQIFQSSGKGDIAQGINTFTSGITLAGQALFAFPTKIGRALAVSAGVTGFLNAVTDVKSGAAAAAKQLDLVSSKLEKTSSALNTVNQSYQSLDDLYKSGSATTKEIISLQRNLAKSYAALSGVAGGAELVTQMKTAATPEARAAIQAEATDELQNQKDAAEMIATMTDLKKQHPYRGGGENGVLTPSNKMEQRNSIAIERKGAGAMEGDVISQLAKSTSSDDKELFDRLSAGMITSDDVDKIISKSEKSKTYEGLKGAGFNKEAEAIKRELEIQLKAISLDPSIINEYKKQQSELRSLQIQELYLRKGYNQLLMQSLSSGQIVSSLKNKEAERKIQDESTISSVKYDAQTQKFNLQSLYTSEDEMVRIRGGAQEEQINKQTGEKVDMAKTQGGIAVGKMLGQTLSDFQRIQSSSSTAALAGNIGNARPLDQVTNAAKYFGERQMFYSGAQEKDQDGKIIRAGAAGLIDLQKQNSNNPQEFADEFLGTKKQFTDAGGYEADYGALNLAVRNMISSGDSVDQLGKTLEEIRNATIEGTKQKIAAQNGTTAAIGAIKFQSLAKQLGGTGILDRSTYRQQRRELRRADYQYKHSKNAEIRGAAAATLLAAIPEDKRNYKDPYILGLLNAVSRAITIRQDKTTFGLGISPYLGNTTQAGIAAASSAFKGTGSNVPRVLDQAMISIDKFTGGFEKSLFEAGEALDKFSAKTIAMYLPKEGPDFIGPTINLLQTMMQGALAQIKVNGDAQTATQIALNNLAKTGKDENSKKSEDFNETSFWQGATDFINLGVGAAVAGIVAYLLRGKSSAGVGLNTAATTANTAATIANTAALLACCGGARLIPAGAAAAGAAAAKGLPAPNATKQLPSTTPVPTVTIPTVTKPPVAKPPVTQLPGPKPSVPQLPEPFIDVPYTVVLNRERQLPAPPIQNASTPPIEPVTPSPAAGSAPRDAKGRFIPKNAPSTPPIEPVTPGPDAKSAPRDAKGRFIPKNAPSTPPIEPVTPSPAAGSTPGAKPPSGRLLLNAPDSAATPLNSGAKAGAESAKAEELRKLAKEMENVGKKPDKSDPRVKPKGGETPKELFHKDFAKESARIKIAGTDPYKILGLSKDATAEEVKSAYLRLSKILHPDKNPGDPTASTRVYQDLGNAKDAINEIEKKKLNAGAKPKPTTPSSDGAKAGAKAGAKTGADTGAKPGDAGPKPGADTGAKPGSGSPKSGPTPSISSLTGKSTVSESLQALKNSAKNFYANPGQFFNKKNIASLGKGLAKGIGLDLGLRTAVPFIDKEGKFRAGGVMNMDVEQETGANNYGSGVYNELRDASISMSGGLALAGVPGAVLGTSMYLAGAAYRGGSDVMDIPDLLKTPPQMKKMQNNSNSYAQEQLDIRNEMTTVRERLYNADPSSKESTADTEKLRELSKKWVDKIESVKMAPHLDKSGNIVSPTGAAIPTGDAATKAAGANPKSENSKTEVKPAEPQKVDVKMTAEPLSVNVIITDENGKKIQEMQQQIVQFKQQLEDVTGNKTPAKISKQV